MRHVRHGLRFFLLLPLFALLACGSSSPSLGTIGPPSGDWILNINSVTATGYFAGSLTIQGSNVSGVFQYLNPSSTCSPGTQPISVTGTISSTAINLTSGSFGSGSVATFNIQLPLIQTTTPNYTFGTVQIAGGNCALASTALNIDYISYTGNYSGTLTGGSVTGQATLSVTQGPPNSAGQFTVSGASLSFSSSSCNFSATGTLTGLITGYTMQLSSGTIGVTANAESLPISLSISGGCTGAQAGTVLTGSITP
jgi:hypothetical protein